MNHSEQINELSLALAQAQGKFQSIKRSKTVEVAGKTRDGRDFKYKYAYAPLDEILNATRPALSENGLAIVQTTDEGDRGTLLKTMLIHGSGQWVASYKNLGHFEDPQKFGGALTYYRRYEVSAILGVSSEEDDDANGVSGNEASYKQKPRPKVDPETGEVTQPQQPKPDSRPVQPVKQEQSKQESKPANGNGHKQLNPEKLLAEVNAKTGNFYPTTGDLYKAIGAWPNFKDSDSVEAALSIAVDYANQMKPVEA